MWEYTTIQSNSRQGLTEKANKLGEEGWEGFGFAIIRTALSDNLIMTFKRRLDGGKRSQF
ncbi:MAG: hypothetical protein FWH42_05075 [Dehalococcoidia bacterium]|nr:hypothetical protein [Dehalococcoidia bacterium]